ncbi:MAG: hypothetical protein AB8H03_12590 [Saprospiraceae bacterium]
MSQHVLQLQYIECANSADKDGDDVYIEVQPDARVSGRFPFIQPNGNPVLPTHTMKAKEKDDPIKWWLGPDVGNDGYADSLKYNFEFEVQVVIWDQDAAMDPNTATFLVNYDFTFNGNTENQVTPYIENTDGAKYRIGYRFIS